MHITRSVIIIIIVLNYITVYNNHCFKQIIKKFYLQKNAEVGPDRLVEFDSESIHLDIPKEGITTEDNMWTIYALAFPPEVFYYDY